MFAINPIKLAKEEEEEEGEKERSVKKWRYTTEASERSKSMGGRVFSVFS